MSQAACEAVIWGYRLSSAAATVSSLGEAKLDSATTEQSLWFNEQNVLLADAAAKLESALAQFPGANAPIKNRP